MKLIKYQFNYRHKLMTRQDGKISNEENDKIFLEELKTLLDKTLLNKSLDEKMLDNKEIKI